MREEKRKTKIDNQESFSSLYDQKNRCTMTSRKTKIRRRIWEMDHNRLGLIGETQRNGIRVCSFISMMLIFVIR